MLFHSKFLNLSSVLTSCSSGRTALRPLHGCHKGSRQYLMGHGCTSARAHIIQQSCSQCAVRARNAHWLQYSAAGEHSYWHCWISGQAFCWVASKQTKWKRTIGFPLNFLMKLDVQYHKKWKLLWLLYILPRIILLQFLGVAKTLNGKGKTMLWSGVRCRAVMKSIFKTVLWRQGWFSKTEGIFTRWLETRQGKQYYHEKYSFILWGKPNIWNQQHFLV